MVALFILLSAIAVSFFLNRIATKALMLTGLSRQNGTSKILRRLASETVGSKKFFIEKDF